MADGIDVNVGIRVKLQRRSCAGSTRAFKLVYEVSMRSKEPQDKEVILLNIIDIINDVHAGNAYAYSAVSGLIPDGSRKQ